MDSGLILTIMLPIFATTALGVFAWATRRIISRIDAIGDKLEGLATRVTVIETKQDLQTDVARKTARKVGVRQLPPEVAAHA